MKWINVKDRKPTPEDSPILAMETEEYFSTKSLQYIDGWDGNGWYSACEEYGMGLNDDEAFYHQHNGMKYWMPIPESPTISEKKWTKKKLPN